MAKTSRSRAAARSSKPIRSVEEFRARYFPEDVRREKLQSADPEAVADELVDDILRAVRKDLAAQDPSTGG